jgi:hypothetical protein
MQLREGVLAGRRNKNQELLDGGMEGFRPDWLEKRKKMQIDWRRRGWSHGIGEQARLNRSSAPPLRIRGAAGSPLSLFPSLILNLRYVAAGGVGARISPARSCCRFPRAQASRAAPFSPALAKLPVRRPPCRKNRRHTRLGDDSRRHTHGVPGALDARNRFPPGRQGDD